MLHAVLFELEGVLVDTRDLRRRAIEDALAADGLRLRTADAGERFDGLPTRAAMALALSTAGGVADETAIDLATVRAERAFLTRLAEGFALADGAREFLAAVAGRCRLVLVTRATRQETDVILTAAELDVVFELVVTADDSRGSKPSPAPYLHALGLMARRRPVVSHGVVAFEDGWAGIASARGAKLRCLAVGPLAAYGAMEADGLLPTLRGHSLATIEHVLTHRREHIA